MEDAGYESVDGKSSGLLFGVEQRSFYVRLQGFLYGMTVE